MAKPAVIATAKINCETRAPVRKFFGFSRSIKLEMLMAEIAPWP